jgi:hypothetical protein
MKKISLVLASVLISSLVLAKDSDIPKSSGSSIVVTNSVGSTLFKIRYASEKIQKLVRVTLFDENGNSIYSETIYKTDGFIRPYNFKGLPEGHYAIQVEDENGKTSENINFNSNEVKKVKIEKNVRVIKVPGETSKYVLMISSLQKDNVTINIFDKENNLVHSEEAEVVGGFGKVYALKEISGFRIEVSDSNGLVKSAKF